MNNQSLVSIIVPIYNGSAYLHTCLDSIINQSYQHIEIICVDDCSRDTSLTIAEEYRAKDSRFHIITNEKNLGILFCRKMGIEAARGEYILFCDCDDWLAPDITEHCVEQATVHRADVIHFNAIEVYPDGGRKIYRWAGPNYNLPSCNLAIGIQTGTVSHGNWGKFIDSKILKNATATNLLDANFKVIHWEDLMLWLVVSQFSKNYLALDKVGYYYRRHSTSVTGSYNVFHGPAILIYLHSFIYWLNGFVQFFSLSFSQITIIQKSILRKIMAALKLSKYSLPTEYKSEAPLRLAYFIGRQQVWRREYLPNMTWQTQQLPTISIETIINDRPQWVALEDGICFSFKSMGILVLVLSSCKIECWLLTDNTILRFIKKIFRPNILTPDYCKNYFSKIIHGKKINAQMIDAMTNDYCINNTSWPK